MSAEVLRDAAGLMRERAQATDAAPEGAAHWFAPSIFVASGFEKYDAVHIASWPPAVALAVADWLDDALEAHLTVRPGAYLTFVRATAVAHAYLGESA